VGALSLLRLCKRGSQLGGLQPSLFSKPALGVCSIPHDRVETRAGTVPLVLCAHGEPLLARPAGLYQRSCVRLINRGGGRGKDR